MQPEPVRITRATVISAEPFPNEDAARAWLAGCGGRGDQGDEEIGWALGHLNVAVAAYRVASGDAHARDVSGYQAVRIRLGYGSGSQLVNGAWNEALLLPRHGGGSRVRRRMLSPEEELAGILTGRRPPAFASEELLMRARLDLDAGRHVAAALQARAALDALTAELTAGGDEGPATRHAETAASLCDAALSNELTAVEIEQLEQMVTQLERTVRRRRYG